MASSHDFTSMEYPFHQIKETAFNSFVIKAMLTGLYTLLFIQALCKLLKHQSIKLYVLGVTSLWVSVLLEFVILCRIVQESGGIPLFSSSPDPVVFGDDSVGFAATIIYVPEILTPTIANGLMVWRCTILWSGNKWIALVLYSLLLGSTVGNAWGIMSQDISSNTPNLVSGISEIASAVTTVCATGLITLRIILVTRNSPQRNFYQRIIQIITESTVLSSVILLFVGTLKLTDVRRIFYLRTKLGLGEEIALSYAGAITGPILGIATTLISFRAAEEKPQTDISPLSRLTFRRSGPATNGGTLEGQNLGREHHNASMGIHRSSMEPQESVVHHEATNSLRAASGSDSEPKCPRQS